MEIVEINSDVSSGCKECGQFIEGPNFADSVNHYISLHGYKVLHVGSRTGRDQDGHPFDMTVAILQK
jgi:hypothetical protein